ncbi:MAG TPA: asparagine synthase C-terminal domain-containing protein [Thermoplasmata archaeon]|nr:asparagine synthase C-terminal domain-containing protein [Thermoplasmata archaeon]
MEAADAVERLSTELRTAVDRTVPRSGGISVLYSGGLDSSILAWLLRHRPSTHLLTIGLPGSHDLGAGKRGAELLGLPWTGRELPPELDPASPRLRAAVAEEPPTRLASVQLAFELALAAAPEPVVVTGQGADELFWGYAHFRGLASTEGPARAAQDLDRLLQVDWPETERIAAAAGRRLVAPYLDPDFRTRVARVDAAIFQWSSESKPLLRRIALHLGLPPELARRPKKAMQYGTGVDAWLRTARRSRRAETPSGA